jgi:HAD superfamily phosphatase (TIGR01681 family)
MWETDWAAAPDHPYAPLADNNINAINPDSIAKVFLLHWEEHCVECAAPQCFLECRLYAPRADLQCARFRYGIYPNPSFSGLYAFGADVHFKRWGKLESKLDYSPASTRAIRRIQDLDRAVLKGVKAVAPLASLVYPSKHANLIYAKLRDKALKALSLFLQGNPEASGFAQGKLSDLDEFIIEAWNPQPFSFHLILELDQKRELKYRHQFELRPGRNAFHIPISGMNLAGDLTQSRIFVYPENDLEVRVIFTWLDFVGYKSPRRRDSAPVTRAQKVKCVVWDLDNTLWDGILVEDGPEQITLRPEALQAIKALDERGILLSIASKNDHSNAWSAIQKFQLQDYFLNPAINWGPKSESIRRIANELNLDLDTFAFIDDSETERRELKMPGFVGSFGNWRKEGLIDWSRNSFGF